MSDCLSKLCAIRDWMLTEMMYCLAHNVPPRNDHRPVWAQPGTTYNIASLSDEDLLALGFMPVAANSRGANGTIYLMPKWIFPYLDPKTRLVDNCWNTAYLEEVYDLVPTQEATSTHLNFGICFSKTVTYGMPMDLVAGRWPYPY